MPCVVDRVVICDAFEEPERHYHLRDGVRAWREAGCPDTARVTRRLLEWRDP